MRSQCVTSTKWRQKKENKKRYRKTCVNRHEGGFRLYLVQLMDSSRQGAGKTDLKRTLCIMEHKLSRIIMGIKDQAFLAKKAGLRECESI